MCVCPLVHVYTSLAEFSASGMKEGEFSKPRAEFSASLVRKNHAGSCI